MSIIKDKLINDKDYLINILLNLYKGNGYFPKLAVEENNRNDILIYSTKEAPKPLFILRVRNDKNSLAKEEVLKEYIDLESIAKEKEEKYNCKSYILISLNGYSFNTAELKYLNIRLEDFNYISSLSNSYKREQEGVIQRVELHAHNQHTYAELLSLLDKHHKAAVIQATGTGKTYIIMKFIEENRNKNIMIVEPSNYISEQIKNSYFCDLSNVKFVNYQKLHRVNIDELESLKLDAVFFDEMHRLGAKEWVKGYGNIIKLKKVPMIIGLSATPVRTLDNFRDMKEEIFDNISTEELSLTDAIVRDILPMPTYVSALFTLDDEFEIKKDEIIHSFNTNNEKDNMILTLENIRINWKNTYGVEKLLQKHIVLDDENLNSNLRFIIFCENFEHLKKMKSHVEGWFSNSFKNKKINSNVVTSHVKDKDIQLNNFTNNSNGNSINLLFTIDMLNEGVHISNINGVVLLRKTTSNIIYKQQIGRALEVNNYSPVVFDFVNNFNNIKTFEFKSELKESIEKNNNYKEEFNLPELNEDFLLKVHDYILPVLDIFEKIDLELKNCWDYRYNQLLDYKEENGDCNVQKGYEKNPTLAMWVSKQRSLYKNQNLSMGKIKLLDDVGFAWDPIDEAWFNNYKQLEMYLEKNGHCNILKRCKENPKLGMWVSNQRYSNNMKKLAKKKIELLNKLGFDWNPIETAWFKSYHELQEYKVRNGNCNVTHECKENPSLGKWITNQRKAYKKGKLTKKKIDLLNSLDFDFEPLETYWFNRYDELIVYKGKNGNCEVPKGNNQNSILGSWVASQRKAYKEKNLSKKKIELLNKIDFSWYPLEESWDKSYKELISYKNENGDCNVPYNYKKNPTLYTWVTTQRKAYNELKVSNERVELLNKIGFDWSILKEIWHKNYNELKMYKEKNGHCNISSNYKENPSLAGWIIKQRMYYNKKKLSEEKIELLNMLEFDWDPLETAWYKNYNELKQYTIENGTCNIPKDYKGSNSLNLWIKTQRGLFKKRKMSNEKIKMLNDLGFIWDPLETTWRNNYNNLKAYIQENGSCDIPRNCKQNPVLGTWVTSQRANYKKGKLPNEKIELLNNINFDWAPHETIWYKSYNELKMYNELHGCLNIPSNYKGNISLGKWINTQRMTYKNGKLSKEKIDLLNELGFIWSPRQEY